MSLRNLPAAREFPRPKNFSWEPPSDVMVRWLDKPLAAESDDPNTISIYDVIGEDFWSGDGFTARRAAAALRSIGANPVTININSPGGDMFEGIAIYNIVRQHKAKVTVNVMGIAASAASIIAMAGDEVRMGLGTFLMVHNAWGLVVGNRHDMRDGADLFEQFDGALADVYEARTGQKRKDIVALMDAETFMAPSDAIEKGFADAIDESLEMPANAALRGEVPAARKIEAALAAAGIPRNQRRSLIGELSGSSAVATDRRSAVATEDVTGALARLATTINP